MYRTIMKSFLKIQNSNLNPRFATRGQCWMQNKIAGLSQRREFG